MKNKPLFPVADYLDEAVVLRSVLDALNGSHERRRAEMRNLVSDWNRSGTGPPDKSGRTIPIAARMLRKMHPELMSYLLDEKKQPKWQALPWFSGPGIKVTANVRTSQQFEPAVLNEPNLAAIRDVQLLFLEFLLCPSCLKLSTDPCARCGNYYLKKTERQKVYCSRKCAKDRTAAYSTVKRLKEERQEKLATAAQLIARWTLSRTREPWKRWVSKQKASVNLGIKPKFITRAVNNGELQPPQPKGK